MAARRRIPDHLPVPLVNCYTAHKQHLPSDAQIADVVGVTRDIVALHATGATGPYLSLWSRIPQFERTDLEEALYDRRELARVLCMRTTLHLVPSDKLPLYFQAYTERQAQVELQGMATLLVQAGLCAKEQSSRLLAELQRRVLAVMAEKGTCSVRTLSQAVPELEAKVRYSADKTYGGEFSIGSRLVPGMCTQGLLIRARPRGTWRSNLFEYATLSDWLPEIDLQSVTPREARTWLVRQYLSTFGPATASDVQWWTGFTKGETKEALGVLEPEVVAITLENLADEYLMLSADARKLQNFVEPRIPGAFFLPGLDPYIMGYQDRRRFLADEHRAKVFDRAGNALPTVWLGGRVAGAWGQRRDGSVIYGLFEAAQAGEELALADQASQLEQFLGGEFLPQRSHTAFTRALK